ncbi:MAG: thiamine-phosphate synthase family protein, partial [Syntrophales bacterium]|nr:thiamine-phosphate synthase family protein [Syntrophales bacterium]
DVAAFPGRLVKSPQGLLIPAAPAFGASRRLAGVILKVLDAHPHLRAAMNIREVEGLEGIAALLSFKVATTLEPGEPPSDLIYDRGDGNREPLLLVLGPDPETVAEKVLALKNALSAAGKLAGC